MEVEEGDVLVNITGDSVARSCQVDVAVLPARVNQHVAILRPDPRRLWPRFLRYSLVVPAMQAQMRSLAGAGATRNALTKSMIESFEIVAPADVAEQRAIADVLSTLDDKIELNRRMNETLEQIAKTRFSVWLDEHRGAIEFRLVQELIDRQVLLIGDGYRAKLSELGNEGLPFVRAGNLQEHGFVFDGCEILSSASVAAVGQKISRPNDVAFTSKGTVGRITRVTSKTRRFVYSPQVCFWRVLDQSELHPNVLYRWMASHDFLHQVAAVKGQTDMAEYVSLKDQRRMTVNLPPRAAQIAIGEWLHSIDERVAANHEQNQTLTALRDALLPKLISGEIRIGDGARMP